MFGFTVIGGGVGAWDGTPGGNPIPVGAWDGTPGGSPLVAAAAAIAGRLGVGLRAEFCIALSADEWLDCWTVRAGVLRRLPVPGGPPEVKVPGGPPNPITAPLGCGAT